MPAIGSTPYIRGNVGRSSRGGGEPDEIIPVVALGLPAAAQVFVDRAALARLNGGGELDGADDAGLFDQVANSLLTGQRFGGGAAVGRKLGARVAGRVRAVVRIFAARRDDGQDQIGQRRPLRRNRSEEHTSELQSLMRISYAGFCLQKKKQ